MTIFGVTRAGIIQHFSVDNNVTDLTNKATTQHNLSILLGIINAYYIGNIIGFGVSMLLPSNFSYIFGFISAMTIYHLYTGIKSVNSIILDEFNIQRMYILCDEFIKNKKVISPNQVYLKEKMIFRDVRNIHFCQKTLEFLIVNEGNDDEYLMDLIRIYKNQKFFCYAVKRFNICKLSYYYELNVSLRIDSDNSDIFLAFLYAVELNQVLIETMDFKNIIFKMEETLKYIDEIKVKEVVEEMKLLGWMTNFSILEEKYCRYQILYKSN